MRKLCERSWLCPVAGTIMLLGFIAVGADTVADPTDTASVPLAPVPADFNDLRWDLAKGFAFEWDSAELSAKVLRGADPNGPVRTITISARVDTFTEGLVSIDVDTAGIVEALDEHGIAVNHQPDPLYAWRHYLEDGWWWSGHQVSQPQAWYSFALTLHLPDDPNQRVPSAISELKAYIYAVYADEVIAVDIPFDPNYGWHDVKAAPGLMIRVDPTTPPCPGPPQYEKIPLTGTRLDPSRSKTPVPLYKYETRIKATSGAPMMAIRDFWPLCSRELCPLGDYAIVRTELLNSKSGSPVSFSTQAVQSDLSGSQGARCWGQTEQTLGDAFAFDTIRHIIAVHPVEVKIPFVLKNIPIPKPQ
jgi:hypothetical protein